MVDTTEQAGQSLSAPPLSSLSSKVKVAEVKAREVKEVTETTSPQRLSPFLMDARSLLHLNDQMLESSSQENTASEVHYDHKHVPQPSSSHSWDNIMHPGKAHDDSQQTASIKVHQELDHVEVGRPSHMSVASSSSLIPHQHISCQCRHGRDHHQFSHQKVIHAEDRSSV